MLARRNPAAYYYIKYFAVSAVFIIAMLYCAVANKTVPGMNLINAAIFVLGALLFIPSMTQSIRTDALKDLKKTGTSEFFVCSRKSSEYRTGNNNTWAGTNDRNYRISFYGTDQGIENGRAVLKAMKESPRIIWVRPGTWLVIFLLIFFSNFFFYDNVIPFFVPLSDAAFRFFNVFIYYLPCGLAFICPILSFIFVTVRDNILYKCAVKLAAEIDEEESSDARSSRKIIACPNCGTKSSAYLKNCSNCGCSLEE